MKSKLFIPLLLISCFCFAPVLACGPMECTVGKPFFFSLAINETDEATLQRRENLLLWQQQTSPSIPLKDIEEVIYGELEPEPTKVFWQDSVIKWTFERNRWHANRFLTHLYTTQDDEALNFIMLAKHIEKLRADRNSLWYYPKDKSEYDKGFDPAIATILHYNGQRFRDRYSLQLVRALFASGRYNECREAFNTRLANLPSNNLMRRLTEGYAAGAAIRTDDTDVALQYFASIGDAEAITPFIAGPFAKREALNAAAKANPDSPKLLAYIEKLLCTWDAYANAPKDILAVANNVLHEAKVMDRVPWLYISAYLTENYPDKARLIDEAYALATDQAYKDYIRAYRMCVHADMGRTAGLLGDLKWLEHKVASEPKRDDPQWVYIAKGIVFWHLVPYYVRTGNMVRALQLANYGDNMPLTQQNPSWQDYISNYYCYGFTTGQIPLARKYASYWNPHDFCNTFFRLLNMQSASTVEKYIASLQSQDALAAHLNAQGHTNRNYLWDIAGTLALRQMDYRNAVRYLARVSPSYQKLLNVDRDGYLKRDPFEKLLPNFDMSGNLKLNFATRMLRLEKTMNTASNPNERADATLAYATGYRNSFGHCWALTAYAKGNPGCDFNWDFLGAEGQERLKTLHAVRNVDPSALDDRYDQLIAQALNEYTDPERLAKAYLFLHQYRNVVEKCPQTKTAEFVREHCDGWRDWMVNNN